MNSAATPEALWQQAVRLDRAGRFDDAIAAYQRLLSQKPGTPDAWYNLAQAQWRTRRFEDAMTSYARALALGISRAEEVHLNRAVILAQHLGQMDEAVHELERALEVHAGYAPALLNLGNIAEQQGDAERARAMYTRALQADSSNALALSRLPNLQTLQDPEDPLIARLAQAAADTRRPPDDRADLGFGLGKALDDVGRHDEAFAAYQAANAASRAAGGPALRYDAAAHERRVDRLMRQFPGPAPRADPAAAGPAPIFICGMFRSGSTLIEQLLAAHPRVTAGGELDLIPAIATQHLPPDGDWPVLDDPGALGVLAADYLRATARLFPGAGLLTDKRPDNFLHIGLIKAMFPEARIVCTTRDPVDNCLSIFFLHLSRSMPYAFDLQDIAHWYRQHRRLMAHWKALYGADIHEVDYDAFVSDPEPVARGLLSFCGLPWEPACLDFHRVRNVVRTASLWQVRQPLHRRASGRWRHYERHLTGLREALAA